MDLANLKKYSSDEMNMSASKLDEARKYRMLRLQSMILWEGTHTTTVAIGMLAHLTEQNGHCKYFKDVDVIWQKIERHLAEEEASRTIMHNTTKAFKTSIANVNTSINNVDNTMLQYNKELEGKKSDGLGKRRNLKDHSPEDGTPSDDYRIREANVSQLFRNFQNKSIWIAKNGGLFVESNVHEILSLSSIFLLTPNSHSKTIIDIFGFRLLDEIHQNVMPVQNITLNWPNKALNESKSRKYKGQTKQPDFVVSIIHQLQTDSVIFVGEVSPPSQRNNVYKNCKDLIRLGVFMKDCVDLAIDKSTDINVFGFHCVDYIIDFYITELIQGTYFMVHIGQVSVPASIKEMPSFVDELEFPSLPSNNAIFKRDTLGTPKFNQL
ncbi:7407_t:CDS:10, partial [Funneliformis caledonium]